MNETTNAMIQSLNGQYGAMMVGGKFLYDDQNNTVIFRFRARAISGINTVKMNYNDGLDLFNITFSRVTTKSNKEIKNYKDIYAEDVRGIFEEVTGLYLSL